MPYVLSFPKNKQQLGSEIKLLCDSYWEKEMGEADLIKYVAALNRHLPFMEGGKVDEYIAYLVGKRRSQLLLSVSREIKNG